VLSASIPSLNRSGTTHLRRFRIIGETLARSVRLANAKLRERGWAPRYRSVREGFSAVVCEIEADRATRGHAGRPGIRA